MTQPTQADEPTSDWDTARDRAALLRIWRTEPSISRQRANRWLAPVLAALWMVSITAHLLALSDTSARHTLQLIGSSTALILIVLGIVWLFVGGQFNFGNRYDSPAIPLTKADRRHVRRQLTRKAPIEISHADVLLELAYQQKRQTLGALTLFAIEFPNSLGVALSDSGLAARSLTLVGLLLFLGLGVYCIPVLIRLKLVIRQLSEAAATSMSK